MFRLSAIDNLLTSKYMRVTFAKSTSIYQAQLRILSTAFRFLFFVGFFFFAECVRINLITIYGQRFLSLDDLVFSTSWPYKLPLGVREAFYSNCTRKDKTKKIQSRWTFGSILERNVTDGFTTDSITESALETLAQKKETKQQTELTQKYFRTSFSIL